MIDGGIGTVLNGVLLRPTGAQHIPYLSVALFLIVTTGLAIASRQGITRTESAVTAAGAPR
jgi:hypothetical protein